MLQATQTNYTAISAIRKGIGCTWYKLSRYQKLGLVSLPDGFLDGRPIWRASRLPAIKAAVANYEEGLRQAHRAEIQKQIEAEREAERQVEEARKARTQELVEMYQRRAAAVEAGLL